MARAGAESVTRLIHRIWVASSGRTTPEELRPLRPMTPASTTPPKTVRTSPILDDSRKRRNFLMLSKMRRPSRTASTMVAKLSSASTMAAASLVTCVPVTPMATPMSAARSAGASLTPSPVMDTVCPCDFRAPTMRILCSGATRA